MPRIDLNCDLGEGAGHDAELMPLITSANIACGGHAGDEATMHAAIELAKEHGVAVGAHPGFADRGNFGRREQPATVDEVVELVCGQVRILQTVARAHGVKMVHVKPHGALYSLAARDAAVAQAVARAVFAMDPRLVLFGLAGSCLLDAGRSRDLRVASEAFADRTYRADGSLTPRSRPDALINNVDAAVVQVLRLVREGLVRATDGTDVPIRAETVCLHGDGPQAVAFARRLHTELKKAGIELRSPA